jgi:hypothetical protein
MTIHLGAASDVGLHAVVVLGLFFGVACSLESDAGSAARGTRAGSAGAGTDSYVVAAANPDVAAVPPSLESCDPGSYVGTYACKLVMQGMPTDLPIEGVVSFELEVNGVDAMQSCPPGVEFCDFDLVIKEGSGELFGFVLGVVGFQTGLQGGLDCRTGKFQAVAVGGIYGIPWEDPADPEKLKVAVELGTFDGTLEGLHAGKIPQVIAGTWNLGEPSIDIYCPGPFSVELMP